MKDIFDLDRSIDIQTIENYDIETKNIINFLINQKDSFFDFLIKLFKDFDFIVIVRIFLNYLLEFFLILCLY